MIYHPRVYLYTLTMYLFFIMQEAWAPHIPLEKFNCLGLWYTRLALLGNSNPLEVLSTMLCAMYSSISPLNKELTSL